MTNLPFCNDVTTIRPFREYLSNRVFLGDHLAVSQRSIERFIPTNQKRTVPSSVRQSLGGAGDHRGSAGTKRARPMGWRACEGHHRADQGVPHQQKRLSDALQAAPGLHHGHDKARGLTIKQQYKTALNTLGVTKLGVEAVGVKKVDLRNWELIN